MLKESWESLEKLGVPTENWLNLESSTSNYTFLNKLYTIFQLNAPTRKFN